ncbi:unnamed protein product [Chironomus riparius]|uniref:Gustatory receptor n=1 Tax=Chironomus riparius TaxID=315576 RepID=A0A9N9WR80_9DIPT|nr:unnamed protein product [Chironomus riparius]
MTLKKRITETIFYTKENVKRIRVQSVKFPSINFNAIKFHLPTRGTRDDYMYDGTFHEAVGSILAVAQLFGEHLLSITVGAHGANNCPTIKDPIKAFFVRNYPQVWLIFPYSGWLSSLTKFLNIILTFAWSYTDLFVIIISIGLTSKFDQLNDELRKMKGKRGIRPDQKPTFAHTFYFWISLSYLIGRTLAVSLYSAGINDASKKPLEVFRSVCREDWCVEVKRFNEEVAHDTIALSGMKFFYLTRKLVLSVAGTIV